MAGTRDLGANFETTDGGLHLSDRLVKTKRTALVFASGVTEKEFTVTVSGTMKMAILEMPVFGGAAVTGTLSVENSDGVEVYAATGKSEDDIHVMLTDVPLVGANTIKVTLSTDPLSDGTCYVALYLEG